MSVSKGRSFLHTTVNLLLSSSIFSLAAVTASRRPECIHAVAFTGTLHRAFTKQTLSTPVRSLCCAKPPGSGSAHFAGGGAERIKNSTLRWLKEVVIGLNLCPWANSALMTGAIRLVVSHSRNEEELLKEVVREASALSRLPPSPNATTLVVTEHLLEDFVLDYVPFMNLVDDGMPSPTRNPGSAIWAHLPYAMRVKMIAHGSAICTMCTCIFRGMSDGSGRVHCGLV